MSLRFYFKLPYTGIFHLIPKPSVQCAAIFKHFLAMPKENINTVSADETSPIPVVLNTKEWECPAGRS